MSSLYLTHVLDFLPGPVLLVCPMTDIQTSLIFVMNFGWVLYLLWGYCGVWAEWSASKGLGPPR